ncbi:MAG: hypothetical protein KUG77_19605, partial [Nannocystaceae bacterium]|nr:hypothetical protein [Nannocystaceae bacterium]
QMCIRDSSRPPSEPRAEPTAPRASPGRVPDPTPPKLSGPRVPPPVSTKPEPLSAKAPRKRGAACFYKEDKRSFIRASRKKTSAFEHHGSCYTCRKAGNYVATTLSPPPGSTCRTSHLCTVSPSDACKP